MSIDRLHRVRARYDAESSQEKLDILRGLDDVLPRKPSDLVRLHLVLCFIRAFPDSTRHYRLARRLLGCFEEHVSSLPAAVRDRLWDTGIAGTKLNYRFSYEVAGWLARHTASTVSIDWEELHDTSRLDALLSLLMQPSEADYFDSGIVGTAEWLHARAGDDRTDFEWLLAQLGNPKLAATWSQLYNDIDLPLTWTLSGHGYSTTRNLAPVRKVHARNGGMRRLVGSSRKEILRPVELKLLPPRAGKTLVDVAMASLAVRHRETFHFSYANPGEVYLADVGEGVSVAVFGMRPEHRYPIECTMGYLVLSNGVPVGYGGASALYRQVNTGINIFDEYRGSEAAYLWVQVMRVYRQLTGCTRFIANAYQFGGDNDEALQSGAFWFYYRLGYRPVNAEVRALAKRESARLQRNSSRRSKLGTLRRLASCDMHLTLPGARAADLFHEDWFDIVSMLASQVLADAGGHTSDDDARCVGVRVARDVGLRGVQRWSAPRQSAYRQLAAIVAATEPAGFPPAVRRSLNLLLSAKAGRFEAKYARLMASQEHFFSVLRKACRKWTASV